MEYGIEEVENQSYVPVSKSIWIEECVSCSFVCIGGSYSHFKTNAKLTSLTLATTNHIKTEMFEAKRVHLPLHLQL